MYSIRVATTNDRENPPSDEWVGLTWERLCDVLRYEASPNAAALLAEPVADPAAGLTHWHIIAAEDPKPFLALDDTERAALLAAFHALQAEILGAAERLSATQDEGKSRLAAALRSAISGVDPSTQLWSVRGAPVITGWGRRKAAPSTAGAHIIARAPIKRAPVGGRSGVAALPGAVMRWRGAPAAAFKFPLQPPAWSWWLPFTALVATIYYLLLPACAIDLPLVRAAGSCARGSEVTLDALAQENDSLRRAVFEAEKGLADTHNCRRRSAGNSDTPSSEEAKRRADEAKLSHGRMDVTLAWSGREDLDLHVYCPGGHLFHGALQACGGVLDRDRNQAGTPLEDNPIEHAAWAGEPPKGEYRIVVVFYGSNGEPLRAVPYTIVVRNGAQERVFRGQVDDPHKETEAARFNR